MKKSATFHQMVMVKIRTYRPTPACDDTTPGLYSQGHGANRQAYTWSLFHLEGGNPIHDWIKYTRLLFSQMAVTFQLTSSLPGACPVSGHPGVSL